MDEAEDMSAQQERDEQEAGRMAKRGECIYYYSPCLLSHLGGLCL